MSIQHTFSLRLDVECFKRKKSEKRCAETRKEIKILAISKSSGRPQTSPKSARKEKKRNRRKKGWTRKKVNSQNFKQKMKRFWKKRKWQGFLEKIILIVIQAILDYLLK